MIPSTGPTSYPLTNKLWTSPDSLPRWQKVAAKIALLVPAALAFLFELCKPFFRQASLEIQVLKQKIAPSPCPHLIDEMTQEEARALFPRIPLQSLTQLSPSEISALHQAILLGNTPVFIELLVRFPKDALKVPYKGLTPFQMACTLDRKEMGMALIDRLDAEDLLILINGTNPFFFLLGEKQTDLAVHLIRKLPKEHLTVVNKNKSTLLHEAIYQDEPRIINVLIEKLPPGTLNAPNESGITPLLSAIYLDKTEAMKALIEKLPPGTLNAPNESGITPLLSAIYLDKKEAMQFLIRKLRPQDFLDKENNQQTNALLAAIFHNCTDAALAMIQKLCPEDFQEEEELIPQILYQLRDRIGDQGLSPQLPEVRILQALIKKGIVQISPSLQLPPEKGQLIAHTL